ncbi:hypothetical protein CLF_111821 [Clonorchis sinensis]|uniref:Uncharacterized protein n=1 Tax=Clonorchis sinensis TaxID=79923 RepID=G7YVD7_CLOSI|nr:hypothetical protein CLF_111821 [Clonorchis sinensis]
MLGSQIPLSRDKQRILAETCISAAVLTDKAARQSNYCATRKYLRRINYATGTHECSPNFSVHRSNHISGGKILVKYFPSIDPGMPSWGSKVWTCILNSIDCLF